MPAGPSLYERMWEELDSIMDRLMTPGAEAADGRDTGRAEGVAYCLAMIKAPYAPDIEDIRREAVERYEERLGDEDEED